MEGSLLLLILLPALVMSSGDGNIRLLEEEVTNALKACVDSGNTAPDVQRQKRFADGSPPIDDTINQEGNQYSHERRNTSDLKDQMLVINATDYDYEGYGAGNEGEKLVNTVPRTVYGGGGAHQNNTSNATNRTRRSEPLFTKPDNDQCLSQCVFANLQVVDSRGIPRETELWNKVQASVTSQQSRAALKDQIGACFQELHSEAEDNGCSYSNKLERCLMLRFSDRKTQAQTDDTQKTESQNN